MENKIRVIKYNKINNNKNNNNNNNNNKCLLLLPQLKIKKI